MSEQLETLVGRITRTAYKGRRRLVAITGAPASGKSTLAKTLQRMVPNSSVVPMDGFHLDNTLLDLRGDRRRKGAPHTFDVDGFCDLIETLKAADTTTFPLFDRSQDRAVPDAGCICPKTVTVLVEGNYLLLKNGGWEALHKLWDLSIYLDVPIDILERRLLDRWTSLGLQISEAEIKTHTNDLPNARLVIEQSFEADITV